jgi:hypothetical protein
MWGSHTPGKIHRRKQRLCVDMAAGTDTDAEMDMPGQPEVHIDMIDLPSSVVFFVADQMFRRTSGKDAALGRSLTIN